MVSSKKFLDELSVKAKNYTVRVKVIDKHRVQAPFGKSKYQHVFLMDDKVFCCLCSSHILLLSRKSMTINTYTILYTHEKKMRATLYTAEIENHADSLIQDKWYDISDAAITPVDAEFQEYHGRYQMTINTRAMVLPIDEEPSNVVTPLMYRALNTITPDTSLEEKFDVVVVVLYVGPTMTVAGGKKVRDIVVTDDSIEDKIIISAWNDFAENVCDQLAEACLDQTPVVSLTKVKRRNFRVFGLTTTLSTFLSIDPKDEKAVALKNWKTNNAMLIEARKPKDKSTWNAASPTEITKILDAYVKKEETPMLTETFRFKVYIPDFKKENISLYVGCKFCGKKTKAQMNDSFDCEFCGRKSAAVARLFFNFTATDGTASIDLVAYTDKAEKMLQVKADDLLHMTNEQLNSFYQETQARFRSPTTYIDVSPMKPTMPHMKICKWNIKGVLVE